jgi:hypothetical protein
VIIVVRVVVAMPVITAEAERTALVGTVWSVIRGDITNLPRVAVAIAGIVTGSILLVGCPGLIRGA